MLVKSAVKDQGLTLEKQWKLTGLSVVEVEGIPGVAVKCVDIRKNTNGESTLLGDGGPHKRWSMWFNSMQREEPYQGLTCHESF